MYTCEHRETATGVATCDCAQACNDSVCCCGSKSLEDCKCSDSTGQKGCGVKGCCNYNEKTAGTGCCGTGSIKA